jgi:outer membrane murein-binding lipoprotein Lpp
MAIKTKKITDLGTINVSAEGAGSLNDSDFFLIGCKSGVTGKVETSALVNVINQYVNELVVNATKKYEDSSFVNVEDVNKVKNEVKILSDNLSDLSGMVNVIASTPAPAPISTGCDCESKVAALESKVATLEAKVAALEGFVQALQADGYLTLANIKKAAADACPLCNHIHEEEQSAE